MKGLLRPLLVGGLTIAVAAAGLFGGRAAGAVNATPTSVTVTANPTVVFEGDLVTVTVKLDTEATEQLGVQVNWADGSPIDFVFFNPGDKQADFGHTYIDDVPSGTTQDQMKITVRAENATTSLSGSAFVLVKNASPTFTSLAVSPSTITLGDGFTVSGVFEDVGKADRHSVIIDWGDSEATGFRQLPAKTYRFDYANAHTYVSAGTYTLTARVTDTDTGWVEASVQLTVLSNNVAPSNLVLAMSAVAEGGTSTLTATFTDPDAADTHNVTVSWGAGLAIDTLPTLAAGITSFAPEHKYADSGPYTVTVVLNDSAGHSITGTTSVSVSNVAPSVSLAAVSSPIAGDNFDLSGTFTDPGTTDTFTLGVDWGDSTAQGTPVLGADGRSFSASHAYLVAGPYTTTVTVTDRDAAPGTASANVVVRPRNVPPTNLTLTAPSVAQGASTTVTGTFSDSDASDTHSVLMSWGDGTPSTTWSLAPGATSISATHGYAMAGTWTVSATVTDAAGASTSGTTQAVVTVPTTTSTSALLDDLTALVQSFSLDRTTERWFVHRINKLKASLGSGSGEFCEALQGVDRLSSVARRILTGEQIAALNDLTTRLKASAHCSTAGDDETGEHGQAVPTTPQKPTTHTTPKPAAPQDNLDKNVQENDHQDKNGSAKSDKSNLNNSDGGDSREGVRHSQANN